MEGANHGQENHKGNPMKKIIACIAVCSLIAVGLFSFSPKKADARGGECNFDLDCGIGLKCVGSFGNKVCVPK